MKLLLFDIDGTLINSGGAGVRGMNRAFAHLYGQTDILRGISLAGRTDDLIMMDAYTQAGLEFSYPELARFKKLYFEFIKEEMAANGGVQKLMPGVGELLPRLAARADVFLALLTGNWESSGRAKIGYFDLNRFFPFGAFSDDAAKRADLVPIAIKRFTEKYNRAIAPHEVFVIGDTPADIHCAKPHGVVSVAVAAAAHSMADLAPHAPDILLPDLADTESVLKIFS